PPAAGQRALAGRVDPAAAHAPGPPGRVEGLPQALRRALRFDARDRRDAGGPDLVDGVVDVHRAPPFFRAARRWPISFSASSRARIAVAVSGGGSRSAVSARTSHSRAVSSVPSLLARVPGFFIASPFGSPASARRACRRKSACELRRPRAGGSV